MTNEALLFPSFEKNLKAEKDEPVLYSDFPYFLKGDISGIQDFIFSVKSKRASRTLKGRSFFIQTLSELCIDLIKREVGEENVRTFYNGGGNFYLLLKEKYEDQLKKIRTVINQDCIDQEFYLTLSVIESTDIRNNFAKAWENIHKESNKDKLTRFSGFSSAFKPYEAPEIETDSGAKASPFEKFTRKLIDAKNWDIAPPEEIPVSVGDNGVACFGGQFKLKGKRDFRDIVYQLPVWNEGLIEQCQGLIGKMKTANAGDPDWETPKIGNVIEFEYLAEFADKRTGTSKLAALKMDVDNLGKLFQNIAEPEKADKLSRYIKGFFGEFIKQLLEESFEYTLEGKTTNRERFFDNIYVVFAGGDDCFFLGGWDAVFEFASRFHKEFEQFSKFLKREIGLIDPVTISAALVMVGPKFPINRFAAMAEEDLGKAKAHDEKNRIVVFDKVMTWDSFEEARALAKRLASLVYQGENRAILERLQYEATLFEKHNEIASQGLIKVNSSWRLLYTIKRNVKNENLEELEKVVREYSAALVASFASQTAQQTPHIHKMPVAARWAEFLTRLKIDKTADSYEQIES